MNQSIFPGFPKLATTLRVLILEDNPTDVELILHTLRRAGYEPIAEQVELEQDYRDCLQRAPEIILADFSMPQFDALRALDILRECHLDIPFIIVSGTIGEERAVQVMQRGATDYIMKDRLGRLGQAVAQGIERKRNEAALRQSEVRFQELTAHIHQVLWMMDAKESKILYVSVGYEKLWGRTCQSLLDNPNSYMDGIHPLDRERMVRENVVMFATGHIDVECRVLRPDGSVRWVWIRGDPVMKQGQLVRIACVIEDITEKRRLAEERDALLSRLQLHIERMPLAYILFDADMRIIDWNPTAERIFGYAREEMLGTGPPCEAFVPRSGWETGEEIRSRIRSGDMEAHSINENLTKDGRTITCQWLNTPLISEGGQFIGMLCLAQDVTERREAEVTLHLRDRAIQAATQGILITDPSLPDNPIVYASPGFERITGYGTEEVLGRNCRFLQGKDSNPEAIARLREAIRAGQSCTVELLNYRKDGRSFWNELSISPVRDPAGRLTHFVGVQADVTGRRSLEEQFRQVQKMEAVGQLAGGVAHDFNNLLTIINGYSDLLLERLPSSDPSRELVAEIHMAGERSAGLTRQLLAFSRQQVLAPRVLDLNEVVTDTEKMLRRLIGEDVRLATALDPSLWAVRADPGQVEQVLMNLAVNARDAMPTGGRLMIETHNVELDQMYVRTHPDSHAGPHVLLSMTDNGCGMPPEVRARIFEPFFTTKGPGKGTGLGLATVYGIVRQSGGHLAVSSEIGVGTTFRVYLPQVEQMARRSKARSGLLAPPRGTETVLLVEDEDGVRALTRHVLAGWGYTVLEAANGDEAVRLAARHDGPIHLLITDVVMPGAGGRAVAERVAARHPGVKVLFVSGYTDDAVIRHGVLREGVNFLQKPFSPVGLAHKIREVLDASLSKMDGAPR